jgi:hypothetical protein
MQSGVLKDFDPSVTLATSLLSPSLDPTSPETVTEEKLWQLCEYGWLISSARQPSMPNDTPIPFTSASDVISPTKEYNADAQSPDFEALLDGALSFDFGLLSQVRNHTSADEIYSS